MATPVFLTLVCLFAYAPNCKSAVVPGKALNGTLTIGYLISWSHEWAVGPYMGSAITLGIEEIKRRQLISGYDIEWIMEDTWCQPNQGTKAAISVWSRAQDLDVIIGPACSPTCQTVSLVAASWGIPVISYSCLSDILSNAKEYPNFARTVGSSAHAAIISNHIAEFFGWNRVGIISDTNNVYLSIVRDLENLMKQSGRKTFIFSVASTISDSNQGENILKMRQIMRLLKNKCRIIFAFMFSLDVRNLLVIAQEENMLKGFVYVGLEAELPWEIQPTFRPDVGLEVYEGVIDLEVSIPKGPQWDAFRQNVIDSFQSPEFDEWTHVGPNASIDEISNYAGYIHDALLLWAYGVNRSLEQGHPPDDSFQIIRDILGFSFEGISGTVTIDSLGDRNADYDITIMQNGQAVHMMTSSASEDKLIKLYKPKDANNWDGLLWPGGVTSVPADSPPCGWKNENCQKGNENGSDIAASCGALVMAALFTGIVTFIRRKRFEKQLQDALSCLVSWNEIQQEGSFRDSHMTITSSFDSSGEQQKEPRKVCRYKSKRVTITPFNYKGRLDLHNRKFLLELKILKEMHHDNLNPFVGICLDTSHECVVMGYASRGTLHDMIMKSNIALSWDFKVSFMADIIHGMQHLHASYGCHGNLSSMTCVIDHRWICKVTDYGLRSIKKTTPGDKNQCGEEYALLWKAPELLQVGSDCEGSEKGDVYSFGIISQEVLTGEKPYTGKDLTPCELVNALKNKPGTCSQDLMEIVKTCLSKSPRDRPTFSLVASSLSKNNGKKHNLVDSMIAHLEVHSTRLEAEVAERTAEIVDEKQKVEFLLAELIPLTIIESLKHGRTIEPEAFDNVSIFFSDVVSFTRISAAGTPIDVVRMLNMMYTVFDNIASKFEVYKIATIGDAYFVASGVPIRNGRRHAVEICDMAVELLKTCRTMKIPHIAEEMLQLRIGIHSGPCLAGVVGLKMPRYLLFGETVDIAQMLESSGEAMRIHVSQNVVDLLLQNEFSLKRRSEYCHLKGYGPLVSYWLEENKVNPGFHVASEN